MKTGRPLKVLASGKIEDVSSLYIVKGELDPYINTGKPLELKTIQQTTIYF